MDITPCGSNVDDNVVDVNDLRKSEMYGKLFLYNVKGQIKSGCEKPIYI